MAATIELKAPTEYRHTEKLEVKAGEQELTIRLPKVVAVGKKVVFQIRIAADEVDA